MLDVPAEPDAEVAPDTEAAPDVVPVALEPAVDDELEDEASSVPPETVQPVTTSAPGQCDDEACAPPWLAHGVDHRKTFERLAGLAVTDAEV